MGRSRCDVNNKYPVLCEYVRIPRAVMYVISCAIMCVIRCAVMYVIPCAALCVIPCAVMHVTPRAVTCVVENKGRK